MTGKGRASILASGAMALALAVWLLMPSKNAEVTPAAKPDAAAQTMEGLKLEGTGADGAKWVLTADRAETDANGELGHLTNVRFVHTSKGGVTTGTAARAERKEKQAAYRFQGGVRIERGEWKAFTESADYDPINGIIRGADNLTVASDGIEITGRGFEIDLGKSLAKIAAASHAVIKPGRGAPR